MTRRRLLVLVLGLAMSAETMAQVTEDTSMGTMVSSSGGTWTISGGTIVGNENQFHSFSRFDVGASETADFTGPAGILNIISRINGNTGKSIIDGTIRSSIDGANLWIINPDGVVFNSNSSLDVSGSVHVSSADYVLLEGGGQFFADPLADSVLTVGNPSTFGFLQPPTGDIVLDGAQLQVPEGETVSLVGRSVGLHDFATLTASGGRLNLVSVGSAGEAALLADGIDNTGINYNNESVSMGGMSTLDVSGESGGSIYIRGGQFSMGGSDSDDELILADTQGAADGGVVDIDVAGHVTIRGQVTAITDSSGAGGDIRIAGQSIGFADRNSGIAGQSIIRTQATSSGNAGSIYLNALGNISLDAQLLVNTESSGDAGDIRIAAGDLFINSLGAITSSTYGPGAGGDIDIDVQGQLSFAASAISAETSVRANGDPTNVGPAGNITITADRLSNSGAFSISTSTNTGGDGGNIVLDGATEISFDNGTISSSSTSAGNGGSVTLRSTAGSITLEENVGGDSVEILSTASGAGSAGSITIEAADTITLWEEASVSAETTGAGSAGDIAISTSGLFYMVGPASIDSRSRGTTSGSAGTITITAGDVSILNGAGITVSTESDNLANAPGQIDIRGTRSVTINNNDLSFAALSATTSGASAGGGIFVGGPVVDIDDSLIRSSTSGAGSAGSINIAGTNTLDLFSSIFEAGTNGIGEGGSIGLSGGDIAVDGYTDLLANTSGTARAGDIRISGENVDVLTAFVEATAGLNGTGGNIDFSASNRLHVGDGATVLTTTQGPGTGGTVTFDSPDIIIDGQAVVSAETRGVGTGGGVEVLGGTLTVTGDSSLLATTIGAGQGGVVRVDNASVIVEGNGSISGNTTGTGTGGTVDISADEVLVHGNGSISAGTDGDGAGGDIRVGGGTLTVASDGRIEATTTGDGNGGSISIVPDNLVLNPGGLITVNATGAGDAGAIDIDANESVFMDNARIESTSALSNGGDIAINARDLIRIRDSEIFASGAPVDSGSPGNAGDIRLGMDGRPDSPAFLLFEGAHVAADAGGSGGAINVFARYMLGADYMFDAHSDTGNDGAVTIHVPATDFVSVISQLQLPVLNVADLLDDQCAVSVLSDRSSFVIDTVGLPPSPEDYRGSGYFLPAARPTTSLTMPREVTVASVFTRPGC